MAVVTAVRASDPVTSKAAAGLPSLGRSVLRRRILSALAWKWTVGTGYTDDELAIILGEPTNVVARRRRDLVDSADVLGFDQALVYDTGNTRPTRTGAEAVVWRATIGGRLEADDWNDRRTPDDMLRVGRANLPASPECPFSPCNGRRFTNRAGLSRHLRVAHGAHSELA